MNTAVAHGGRSSLVVVNALILMTGLLAPQLAAKTVGADLPWTTIEAEDMRVAGKVIGPGYQPHTLETESSRQKFAKLVLEAEYIEWVADADYDAVVLRYSLPDAKDGEGLTTGLEIVVDDQVVRSVQLSSRNAWLYGAYPFSNDPTQGKPRNFYDEVRLKDLPITAGSLVRFRKTQEDGIACSIDLLDFEQIPKSLPAPEDSVSVEEFGSSGADSLDDTAGLRACIDAARTRGTTVWVPPGHYVITGDIVVPSNVSIRGAGMWHTMFVGDPTLYGHADRRVRFIMTGANVSIADFAIVGALNYRNDSEANDGVVVAGCDGGRISRIWVEHTKAGVWAYNGKDLLIEGCRFRNLIADGVNLCVGTTNSVVQNCSARGTGDDCFAIWPVPSDQGHENQATPGHNVIRRCTGQLTFLANGAAIYGGVRNRIEDCLFTDIGTGCGILISTTFPTADEARGIDNNFSDTTLIENCQLIRCGGYDHSWAWRGSLQIAMDRRSIPGLRIQNVNIRDSFSNGITVVAPGSSKGQGTLLDAILENVTVRNVGLGTGETHDLWIRNDAQGALFLKGVELNTVKNDARDFTILRPN